MRAAVLHQPGPLSIEEVQVADVEPREVRIRTMATGLCHSDLHFIEGKNTWPFMPVVMGHEGAGIVEAVGRDVTYVQPGDHVITFPSGFCGHCEYCQKGRLTLCDGVALARNPDAGPRLKIGGETAYQFANLATFGEEMLVHENNVVKIDKEMPFDRAALVGCGVTTGLGAVLRKAQVEPGSNVAVIGAGGIGLNAIQGAVIAGADRVIAVDINPGKLERARQFGATHIVDTTKGDALEQIEEIIPGAGGVDHAFEAVGTKATYELAYRLIRKGGTATMIGVLPDNTILEIAGGDFLREKRVQGSIMGSVRFRLDLPYFIDLYMQGRLLLDELVSQTMPRDRINEGYAAISDGGVARSVVVFD
jgi:S-(hydroxymethyl)glutathione dehydrogenase/alcohol dehydrogenase